MLLELTADDFNGSKANGNIINALWWRTISASVWTYFPDVFPVPDDLTPEEQQELENIRRRKQELLEDIQVTIPLQ